MLNNDVNIEIPNINYDSIIDEDLRPRNRTVNDIKEEIYDLTVRIMELNAEISERLSNTELESKDD